MSLSFLAVLFRYPLRSGSPGKRSSTLSYVYNVTTMAITYKM